MLKTDINQKGIALPIILLLVFLGIVVGILVVKNPTFFSPRADNSPTNTSAAANTAATPSMANKLYEGLLAYWNFDEAAGNGAADLKGAYPGTVTGTTILDGKVGKARLFNAKTDVVDLGNKISMSASNMTVSAWVYSSLPTTGVSQTIVGHFGAKPDRQPSSWDLNIYNNRFQFRINIGPSWTQNFDGWNTCGGPETVLQPNSWNLLTASVEAGKWKMFVNGSVVKECSAFLDKNNQPFSALPTTSNARTIIGAFPNFNYSTDTPFNSSPFMGIADEIGIWNRALSQEEISALAAGTVPSQAAPVNTSGSGGPIATNNNLTADPNPCYLDPNTKLCTANIKWSFDQTVKIRIKEVPGSLFAWSYKGEQAAPWISEKGATFEAYADKDNSLLAAIFVKGVASPEEQDCTVITGEGSNTINDRQECPSGYKCNTQGSTGAMCTDTVPGTCYTSGKCIKVDVTTTPVPTAVPVARDTAPAQTAAPTARPTTPAVPTDNPAYHYHYDSNNN